MSGEEHRDQAGDLLRADDFLLLSRPLAEAAAALMPVPAAVEFAVYSGRGEALGLPARWDSTLEALARQCLETGQPARQGGLLLTPLRKTRDCQVLALVSGMSAQVTERISMQWLAETGSRLPGALLAAREGFLDQATGLYNARVLTMEMETLQQEGRAFSLLLIGVVGRGRTAAGVFREHLAGARLLATLIPGPLFHLGSGIFACICPDCAARDAVRLGRRLLELCRRETGRVHVGACCPVPEDCQPAEAITTCWQAMEKAARQGPYSLAVARGREEEELHPLGPEKDQVRAALGRGRRGLAAFTLLRIDRDGTGPWPGAAELVARLRKAAQGAAPVHMGDNRLYVLLPGLDAARDPAPCSAILRDLENGEALYAAAAAHPRADGSRAAPLEDCARAMLHARFVGPGQVVVFDHVSCNVSGDRWFDDGDLRRAVADYRLGLRLRPDDPTLLNSLGVALVELGRRREAMRAFQRALDCDPEHAPALVNLGNCHQLGGERNQAMRCLEKACRLYEARIAGRAEQAAGLEQEAGTKTAKEDATSARTQPHNEAAEDQREYLAILPSLARLYCEEHRFQEALDILSPAEGREGTTPFPVLRLRAEAAMALGRDRQAILDLQQCLNIHPHDARAQAMLGLLYMRGGEGDEIALSLCRQAVDTAPGNPVCLCALARVCLALGRVGEAERAVATVLRQQRLHAEARLLRARIHQLRGQGRRAGRIYRSLDARLGPKHPLRAELRLWWRPGGQEKKIDRTRLPS